MGIHNLYCIELARLEARQQGLDDRARVLHARTIADVLPLRRHRLALEPEEPDPFLADDVELDFHVSLAKLVQFDARMPDQVDVEAAGQTPVAREQDQS